MNSPDWHLYYSPVRRSDLIRQAAKRNHATEFIADHAAMIKIGRAGPSSV